MLYKLCALVFTGGSGSASKADSLGKVTLPHMTSVESDGSDRCSAFIMKHCLMHLLNQCFYKYIYNVIVYLLALDSGAQ